MGFSRISTGESNRDITVEIISYRSDRGKGLPRTEQVLSRSAIPASKLGLELIQENSVWR